MRSFSGSLSANQLGLYSNHQLGLYTNHQEHLQKCNLAAPPLDFLKNREAQAVGTTADSRPRAGDTAEFSAATHKKTPSRWKHFTRSVRTRLQISPKNDDALPSKSWQQRLKDIMPKHRAKPASKP